MAKKYLSQQEAAAHLGVSEDVLKKAREKGDIRGFADRGNWKYREEDLNEFGRTLQGDSNPDLPILDGNILEDDDGVGEQPTEIRKPGNSDVLAEDDIALNFDDDDSNSGVRLALDPALTPDESEASIDIPLQFGDSAGSFKLNDAQDDGEGRSSADIPLQFGDSSQDMNLALEEDASSDQDKSDSDVRLVGLDDDSLEDSSGEVILTGMDSDSDVRLLDQTQPMRLSGSDSDVRLIKTDSDSDVKLVRKDSDSDVRLSSKQPDSDSDVKLGGLALDDDSDSGIKLASDSGIRLEPATDSGISLNIEPDSGISLDFGGDSGISLETADDSGIALDIGTDSDISLAAEEEEGISLDTTGDSGISLDMPADSGISLDSPSMEATVTMLKVPAGKGRDKARDTSLNLPVIDASAESQSDFDIGALDGDSTSDTSVLMFDDGEGASKAAGAKKPAVAASAKAGDDETVAYKKSASKKAAPVEEEVEEFEDVDLDGADFDEELEDGAEDSEFMAGDDAFDDSTGAGESQGEFPAPAVGGGPVRIVLAEQEWHGMMFGLSLVTAIAMLVCGGVMIDLVRYLWKAGEYGAVAGPMIQMLGK